MAYTPKTHVDGELLTAEDLNRIEQGLSDVTAAQEATAAQVDQIKRTNFSAESLSGSAPAGTAPPGWVVEDLDTGDIWRWEA